MSDLILTNLVVPGRGRCEISVTSGMITDIRDETTGATGREPGVHSVDLGGRLVLPAFVEPHAHLDKAYLADRLGNPTGDLHGAIEALSTGRRTITTADIADRAERAARRMAERGVAMVRTHVDTTLDAGLTNLLGLVEARERCRDTVEIEIAMLLEWPYTGPGSRERTALARDAIAAGADVIGGCPHLDDDPTRAVNALVDLSLEYGLPLDLHADENLRPESDDLGTLARRIIDDGLTIVANASHCVSLAAKEPTEQRRIADLAAEAQITVTVLPQTNLFLQARDVSTNVPRSIAPVNVLRRAGVTVGVGGDNLQDPFNLLGTGDPLESGALMVWASHSSIDDALDSITTGAAACVNKSVALRVGERADLVAFAATSVREVFAERTLDRVIVRAGRVA